MVFGVLMIICLIATRDMIIFIKIKLNIEVITKSKQFEKGKLVI